VTDVHVETWSELHEALFADTWQDRLQRFRSDFAYRGDASATNQLTTSLMRLGGDFRRLESHLLRNFRKYARRGDVPEDSTWNWLALAKHHGLPTRLLDWTYSPYVALHFATATPDRFGEDGAIWCIDYVRAQQQLPDKLRNVLEEEGSNTFTADMLKSCAQNLAELDALGDDFVVFFEPPSLDDRIVNQYALFSLMPSPEARLDHWLERHPELVRRVHLPAELKWEVRDKLDQANVSERVLFPGLDGLSAWLKRHYSPRNADGRSEERPSEVKDRQD
jgi:hypothetical protein